MQQLQNGLWGSNPDVDPEFDEPAGPSSNSPASTTIHIDDPKDGRMVMALNWSSDNRVFHYGLNGRATNVFPTTSRTFGSGGKLVTKPFWSEESHTGEPDVQNDVSVMEFSHIFSDSSTAIIHERLDPPKGGSQVHYSITFQELMPITKLVGDQFLGCWWDTVESHLALWKNGIHHRDISVANLMYKVEGGRVAGVLIDFDLATRVDSVAGNERIGTLPFMALDFLTSEGLASGIEHIYAHDAQSFVWVLMWICLRYDNGELRKLGRPLEPWLRVGALGREARKILRMYCPPKAPKAGQGHEHNWLVANKCLDALMEYRTKKRLSSETSSDANCEGAIQALLAEPHSSHAVEEH
ncbi:hypothetical protein HD554DRAFT_2196978 [Boletus coccyginus]|nr:hypothetical protein HD554DRAFT_2196978 [Boletus coccyginus]